MHPKNIKLKKGTDLFIESLEFATNKFITLSKQPTRANATPRLALTQASGIQDQITMHDFEEHPTRKEFLDMLWRETINSPMQENWIGNSISASQKNPNGPFGDIGPVLERLLSIGASKRDLSLIYRMASYEAVFETLYKMGEKGTDLFSALHRLNT